MAQGTDSFMGKAMPIVGNVTLTGETPADDIFTITGSTSQTGDYFVVEDSSGTELFVIDSSGYIEGTIHNTLSSSALNGITIAVTTTGALADAYQTEDLACAIVVAPSSKAVFNAIIMYDSEGAAAGSQVNDCNVFFAVNGSVGPHYFISVGASQIGLGAPADNGFVNAGATMTADPTSDSVYAGIKILLGSKDYYLLAVPDSSLTFS